MTPDEIIKKIVDSNTYKDVFSDISNWKSSCKEMLLKIHTDVCFLPQAKEATEILLKYKSELERGKSHTDDVGTVTYFPDRITFESSNDNILKISFDNYNKLCKLADSHFRKYLPKTMFYEKGKLTITLENRAIPLSSLTDVPQEHLNWILSRMLEFSGLLDKYGFVHCGITPDSIYVVPENHGIIVISFYHMTSVTSKMKTVSGKYIHFYPEIIFNNKKAENFIDIELAKRTTMFIAGDKSGLGMKYRKILNSDWIDFIIEFSNGNSFDVFKKYREILKNNFEKKFYQFNY